MSEKGLVFDIDRFSTHDGPGIRTAVFLKGCPLSCRWCHSPESQRVEPELLYQQARCLGCLRCAQTCPAGAISAGGEEIEGGIGVRIDRQKCAGCFACAGACPSRALRVAGTLYDAEELVALLAQDLPFFQNSGGGITISGGEPLLQAKFTHAVLQGCVRRGISTAIETCGHGSGEDLRRIADLCALLYFDVKLTDREKHRQWTGLPNATILKNLESLCQSPATAQKIVVRIPCIPGVNDSAEEIVATARLVRALGIPAMQLLAYNPMAGEKYRWIGQPYPLAAAEPRDSAYYAQMNERVEAEGVRAIRE